LEDGHDGPPPPSSSLPLAMLFLVDVFSVAVVPEWSSIVINFVGRPQEVT